MKDNIECLLLQNFNRLGRLALYLTNSEQDAQDLLQETAIRVLVNGEKFALGTVELIGGGRIFIKNTLPKDMKFLIATTAATMLLRYDMGKTMKM